MKHAINFTFVLVFSLLFFTRASAETKPVDIYYFFNNPCASCNEEKIFRDMADEALKNIEQDTSYRIFTYNLFHQENMAKLDKLYNEYKIPASDRKLPMVIINGNYLSGKDNIEKNLRDFFLETTSSGKGSRSFSNDGEVLPSKDPARSSQTDYPPVDPAASYFVYFHTVSCEDCNRTEAFLKTLEKSYPVLVNGKEESSSLVIDSRNLTEMDQVNEIHAYFDTYHVPAEKQQVPIIFYKGGYLSGFEEIKAQLLPIIKSGSARNFTYLQNSADISKLTVKNLPAIFLAGLINGINPCSLSMVFLLLTLLISKNSNIVRLGMTYVAGKVVAYFALGTIFYQLISLLESTVFQSVQLLMKGLLLFFIVSLTLLNLWDLIAAKKENYQHIKVQLPKPLRKFNHGIIKKLMDIPLIWALPVVFGLGIIISAGEFLCTGQIYLATIIYLVKSSTSFNFITAISFIVYVLAMSIPSITLILLVYKGKQVLDISEFTRKNLPLIKLINALLFILFGAYIIFYT